MQGFFQSGRHRPDWILAFETVRNMHTIRSHVGKPAPNGWPPAFPTCLSKMQWFGEEIMKSPSKRTMLVSGLIALVVLAPVVVSYRKAHNVVTRLEAAGYLIPGKNRGGFPWLYISEYPFGLRPCWVFGFEGKTTDSRHFVTFGGRYFASHTINIAPFPYPPYPPQGGDGQQTTPPEFYSFGATTQDTEHTHGPLQMDPPVAVPFEGHE